MDERVEFSKNIHGRPTFKQAIQQDDNEKLCFFLAYGCFPLPTDGGICRGYLASQNEQLGPKNGGNLQQESPFLRGKPIFRAFAVSFTEGIILQFCLDMPYDWIDQNTFFFVAAAISHKEPGIDLIIWCYNMSSSGAPFIVSITL